MEEHRVVREASAMALPEVRALARPSLIAV